MKDVFRHFTIDGVDYPFCFNINVIESIQEEYGKDGEDGMTKWSNLLQPQTGTPSLKALKFMMMTSINEGIDMENDSKEEKREFVSLRQTGRLLTKLDDDAMMFAVSSVSESNNDGKPKN